MANQSLNLSTELYSYMLDQGLREPPVLQRLREATEAEELSIMRSAPEQGQMMAMLIRLMAAKRVLEVGTFTGYATLWMALALPEDGEIITCDINAAWTQIATSYWREAGIQAKVKLHLRPATETLDRLLKEDDAKSFDFVFIDADKENYEAYFERCVELLRPGGLIVVDNVLWGGSVIDPENQNPTTEAIRKFNTRLREDKRLDICMLPVADGVTLAIKQP